MNSLDKFAKREKGSLAAALVIARVVDGSELDWDLWVPKADADQHGRIEALRRAVDKLDRMRFKSFL